MSKLADVAERLAETRRWLDQEAERLAARLDQLEKRAPAAIQTAHRLLDEQLRGLEATERMVQQWMNATAELASAAKQTPQQGTTQHVSLSAVPASPKPQENPAASLDLARAALNEQHEDVSKIERALQTLASAPPEPQAAAATASPLKQPGDGAPEAVDSRTLLDEQPRGVHHRDEGGLERALQTLANMPRPRITPFGGEAPASVEPARRLLEEPQKADDVSKQQPRKLGVVRVA